ncbi:cation transporter [Gammaproteobacteria bacterium]|nr:cation transporter [Gammaproteobacteria bacterium]
MASCCNNQNFDGVSSTYKRVLLVVIALNASMFVIEIRAGVMAGSQALQADALDFLGDTITYSISLFVIGMPLVWRARTALVKGLTLALSGTWILASTLYQSLTFSLPRPEIMGVVALLALAANLISVVLLVQFRNGDSNVRSVWLCSRNDAIGNLAVLLAAGGVWSTNSAWPDLLVAGIMASLFLWSAIQITKQAVREIHTAGDAVGA